jgi:transcriptional regulator with XRE-family HTH domain
MSAKRSVPTDQEVGRRLRIRRLQLGMSQQSLGTSIGLTFQQVQKYEKGMSRISAGRLHEIARVLEIPISYFFDDMATGKGVGQLFEFLETAYSLRLLQAFARIKNSQIQKSTVELVEQIAESTKAKTN